MVLGAVIVLMPRAFRHRKMRQNRLPRMVEVLLTYFSSGPSSPGSQRCRRINSHRLTIVEPARITRLSADSRASPEFWVTG